MIVLTGVSGGLGSHVLETILTQKLLSPEQVRISNYSSNSSSLEKAYDAGIKILHGDMTNPETLRKSYAGADALFLVSYPSVGEERFFLHRNAIDAANEVGIKHVLYTSLTFGGKSGQESHAGVMQAHLQTVEYLTNSGLSWTIIREATYAHLWNNFAGFLDLEKAPQHLEVVVSNDGRNHWASRAELAEGTAKIVAKWPHYAGQSICLTGPKLYTLHEILSLYCQYTNRTFELKKVGEVGAIQYHRDKHSVPSYMEDFLPNWASWGESLAQGEAEYLDPTLETLLGRKPLSFEDMQEQLFSTESNRLDIKDFV